MPAANGAPIRTVPKPPYNLCVTAEAKHIVDRFKALPDSSKREVLAQLLLIARRIDYPEIGDDEVMAVADEVFRKYDRRESRD
jgi:hypothetical protein